MSSDGLEFESDEDVVVITNAQNVASPPATGSTSVGSDERRRVLERAAAEMIMPLLQEAVAEAFAQLLQERTVQEKESKLEKTGLEYAQEAKKKDAVGTETVLDPAHRECSQCDNAGATHHCHDCCGALCHECVRAHARMKCLRQHTLLALTESGGQGKNPYECEGNRMRECRAPAREGVALEQAGPEEVAAKMNIRDGDGVEEKAELPVEKMWSSQVQEGHEQEGLDCAVCEQSGPWSIGDSEGQGQLKRPRSVTFKDGLVYVCDVNEQSKVVVFDATDGAFVRFIGGDIGSGEGQLDCPMAVRVNTTHVNESRYTTERGMAGTVHYETHNESCAHMDDIGTRACARARVRACVRHACVGVNLYKCPYTSDTKHACCCRYMQNRWQCAAPWCTCPTTPVTASKCTGMMDYLSQVWGGGDRCSTRRVWR